MVIISMIIAQFLCVSWAAVYRWKKRWKSHHIRRPRGLVHVRHLLVMHDDDNRWSTSSWDRPGAGLCDLQTSLNRWRFQNFTILQRRMPLICE